MKHIINSKYLVFPVNSMGITKKLSIDCGEGGSYELDIKLDYVSPTFESYIDVSRFMGKEADITVSPDMLLFFREEDVMEIEDVYRESLRPQIHFSAKNGWINDPNGLVYADGVYHMFFQYNPCEQNWGNMHWGHAVSSDLIHWTECDNALFPDDRGTMFSGSAIVDEKNLLGMGSDTVAMFYTTTDPFCQNLSYSTDGCKTVIRHPSNPVLPNIIGANRDPKVIWCEELGCYIMALYLDGNEYGIFTTKNLTEWTELQRIVMENDCECPDIFPLTCNGERYWVLIGAHDKYIVGKFADGKFTPVQDILSLHFGNSAYAGQTFTGIPDGRIVRMVWDRWAIPTIAASFCGQMGVPTDLSLEKCGDKYYLCTNPVPELDILRKNSHTCENVQVTPDTPFKTGLPDTPHIFRIKASRPDSGSMNCKMFGRNFFLTFANNKIGIGNNRCPISVSDSGIDLTVIVDRCSIEIFTDGGKAYMTTLSPDTIMDRNLPVFEISADIDMMIDKIECVSLRSIWE